MGRHAIKTPPHHGIWQDFLDTWREADRIPVFESAWTWDHFYPLSEPYGGPNLEGWTMLAALAQATERIRLGAMVNGMHHRHPAVTANMNCGAMGRPVGHDLPRVTGSVDGARQRAARPLRHRRS